MMGGRPLRIFRPDTYSSPLLKNDKKGSPPPRTYAFLPEHILFCVARG